MKVTPLSGTNILGPTTDCNIFGAGPATTYSVPLPVDLGTRYSWSLNNGGFFSGSTNRYFADVNWNKYGNFTITVNQSNFCGAGPSASLNVNVTPITGELAIFGDTLRVVNYKPGSTFVFFECDGNQEIPTTGNIDYIVPGDNRRYRVNIFLTEACAFPSACSQLPTSILDAKLNKAISLFPNPSNGVFKSDELSEKLIHVYDLSGNMVKVSQFSESIDLSRLKKGIYFVILNNLSNKQIEKGKIVIE